MPRPKKKPSKNRRPKKRPARSSSSKKPRRDSKGGAKRKPRQDLRGVFEKHRKGFGFIVPFNNQWEDIFVPPDVAKGFFHGDRVRVFFDGDGDVFDIKVEEHRFKEIFGKYHPVETPFQKRAGEVIYQNKHIQETIHIPGGFPGGVPGQWVRTRLHFHKKGLYPVTGQIVESFDADPPASTDVQRIANEFSIDDEFSKKALQEAKDINKKGIKKKGRHKLLHIPFMTIDPPDAKDFDDAVYVEKTSKSFCLWVAIADVANYVKPNTAIDASAREKTTSVYFPERAFHMLPAELSENLCSLRPDEERLAMVAEIHFNGKGQPEKTRMHEALIKSRRRAVYNDIFKEWQEGTNPELTPMFELYQLLRNNREERGSIDFDLPEPQIVIDSDGEPTHVENKERNDAHRLIEEFMIVTNEQVTDWVVRRKSKMVFRAHEEPGADSLENLAGLCKAFGENYKPSPHPKDLAKLAKSIKGKKLQPVLSLALLRTMKVARYQVEPAGHFGLASPGYTHFTSPIRRYPDLVVHRIVKGLLNKKKHKEKNLEEFVEHCNYRERLADEAERECIKLKQVRLAKRYLGEEFEATISGMNVRGVFTQIADPYIEAFVPFETLSPKAFKIDEFKTVAQHPKTRFTLRLGDNVKIQITRTDLDTRMIDAELRESPGQPLPA